MISISVDQISIEVAISTQNLEKEFLEIDTPIEVVVVVHTTRDHIVETDLAASIFIDGVAVAVEQTATMVTLLRQGMVVASAAKIGLRHRIPIANLNAGQNEKYSLSFEFQFRLLRST